MKVAERNTTINAHKKTVISLELSSIAHTLVILQSEEAYTSEA